MNVSSIVSMAPVVLHEVSLKRYIIPEITHRKTTSGFLQTSRDYCGTVWTRATAIRTNREVSFISGAHKSFAGVPRPLHGS